MNRRAKFAYSYIIIGLVFFLTGLIIFLNQHLNLSKNLKTSSNTNKKINFAKLQLFAMKSETNNHQEIINLNWYCQIKYASKIQEENTNKETNNEMESTIPKIEEKLEIDFGQTYFARYMLNIFSFVICSTELFHLGFIIWICLCSALLTLFGCVRFYKYDIKLLQEANKANSQNSLNENSVMQTQVVFDSNKQTSSTESILNNNNNNNNSYNWCCCSSIFKRNSDETMFNSQDFGFKKKTNNRLISKLRNSFSSESNINFLAYMNNIKSFYNINQEKQDDKCSCIHEEAFKQKPKEAALTSTKSTNFSTVVPYTKLKRIAPISHVLHNSNQEFTKKPTTHQLCNNLDQSKSYLAYQRTPTILNSFISMEGSSSAFNKYKTPIQAKTYYPIETSIVLHPEKNTKDYTLENFTAKKTKFDEKLIQIFKNNHYYTPMPLQNKSHTIHNYYSSNETIKPQICFVAQQEKPIQNLDYLC